MISPAGTNTASVLKEATEEGRRKLNAQTSGREKELELSRLRSSWKNSGVVSVSESCSALLTPPNLCYFIKLKLRFLPPRLL